MDIGRCLGFMVVLAMQDLQQMLISAVRAGHGMGELPPWVTPCEPRWEDGDCAVGENLLPVGDTTGVNQSPGTQSTSPEII